MRYVHLEGLQDVVRQELEKNLGLRLRGAADDEDARSQAAWKACAVKKPAAGDKSGG